MTDRREMSRREARRRRVAAKGDADLKISTNCKLAATALRKARLVVTETAFTNMLLRHGIENIPKCLTGDARLTDDPWEMINQDDTGFSKESLDRVSLEFAVVWRFFYPLFDNTETKAHLESAWPGFIADFKDAFIALVVDGPFPQAMSGHRGRKHQGHYF